MPAGVSWPTYIKFFSAAMLSMICGAQVVHSVYRPLSDLDKLVEAEVERKKNEHNKIVHSE